MYLPEAHVTWCNTVQVTTVLAMLMFSVGVLNGKSGLHTVLVMAALKCTLEYRLQLIPHTAIMTVWTQVRTAVSTLE